MSSGLKRLRDQSHIPTDGGLPYEDVVIQPAENKKQKSWRDEFLTDSAEKSMGKHGDASVSRDRKDSRVSGSRGSDGRHERDRPRYSDRDNRRDRDRDRERRRERSSDGRDRVSSSRRKDSRDRRDNDRAGRTKDHGNPVPSFDNTESSTKQPAPVPTDITKPIALPVEVVPDIILNAKVDPVDLDAQLEERRRKRREIMEKFAGTQSGATSVATVTPTVVGGGATSIASGIRSELEPGLQTSAARLDLSSTSGNTPVPELATPPIDVDFDVAKQTVTTREQTGVDALPVETRAEEIDGEAQISAADYNPDEDRKKDDDRKIMHMKEVANGVGEPGPGPASAINLDEESEYEEVEVDEEDDEDFDMFAMDEPKKKVIRRKKQKSTAAAAPAPIPASALLDSYDDHEGYYRITPGELMDNGRYKVTINLGKGMFAQVIRAKVVRTTEDEEREGDEVAIKIIRSQESMYTAGKKEAQILAKLAAADPDDRKHVVRMLRTFEHRGHLCLVFENLSMNLRDVVKRFGKDVGLNLRAVRAYAHQMFLALSLMKKCSIIHGDLKPDNILVTENKAMLKVCDLGSACDISEADITPYLVSRFYRAPEIILGLRYDETIDMWSIGCTLYELYTGKILFPGRSNNQMLHLMMDLKGKINHRMIKKAQFGEMHFDENMNFVSVEKDKVTGHDVIKTIVITKAARELRARLIPSSNILVKMKEEDAKLLTNFVDLLDKALTLDPAKRLSARDALVHPFLTTM